MDSFSTDQSYGFLQESELLDVLPWGILVVDEQRLIRRANPQLARWCGVAEEKLLATPLDGLPSVIRAALEQLLQPGVQDDIEVLLADSQHWITFSVARHNGGWVFYGQDITRHKQREQQYQMLAENTPDVLTRWTADLRLCFANAALAAKTGQPMSALLGHTFAEMGVSAEVSTPYMTALQRVFDTGQPQQYYNTFPAPHGPVHYFSRLVPELREGRVETVLGIARDVTELRQTQAEALQLRDELTRREADRYYTLFNAMDEGVALIEVLFDEAGHPTDYRYVEVNPAFARQSGFMDAVGKTSRELAPNTEPSWLEHYYQVLLTGQPRRFEQYAGVPGAWYDVYATRSGNETSRQIALIFTDISARKQAELALRTSEQRQSFLLQLNDTLRPLTGAAAIQQAAAQLLTAYLRVDGFSYVQIEPDEQHWTLTDHYASGTAALTATRGELASFAWASDELRAGRLLVLEDVRMLPRFEALKRDALGDIRAMLAVPLHRHGRWVATFALYQLTPRQWSGPEQQLVQEAAERTWAAMEKARAEAALATSEEKFRALFQYMDEGYAVMEVLLDEAGTGQDFRFVEVNPAFEQQTGLAQPAGRTATELLGSPNPNWVRIYAQVAETGQAVRFEQQEETLGRLFSLNAFRLGGSGSRYVAVLFLDITEQKRAEERQKFLLQLSDALHPLSDGATIQAAATQALGEHLGADHVSYALVQKQRVDVTVTNDWSRDSHVSAKPAQLALPEWLLKQLANGQSWELPDADSGLSEAQDNFCRTWELRSAVAAPALKAGQLQGILIVSQSTPRLWATAEVHLVEEAAERIRAALQRACTEEALRASEQRLRALVENLPGAAVFIVDHSLHYQLAEGEALRRVGYEPADFQGRHVQELAPPGQWPTYRRQYEGALAGRPFEQEHEQAGRTFLTRGIPLPGPTGATATVLAVSYDLTARKQAEQALRLSQERLQLALQAGRMGSFEWTSAGHQITFSPVSESILGLRPDAPLTTSDAGFALVHPADRDHHRAVFEEAGQLGGNYHSTYRIVRPLDQQVRWIEERGQGSRDETTGVVCLRGVHWDVTEQREAQQQLQELTTELEQRVMVRTRELQTSRDLLRSVFDTNLISMSVLETVRDADGTVQDFRLVLVNRELERETDRTDLVGRLYAAEYPGIRTVGIFDLMLQALETGQPQGMEYFYEHEGFCKWFVCQFVRMGDTLVATNLDITERKVAEQERTRNLHLLEQAEAVAGLGSWSYALPDGELIWSGGMYELFALPPGQLVGPEVYLQFAVAEDQPRAAQLVHCLTTGRAFEETLRLQVGGQVKFVRIRAVAEADAEGKPVRVLGVNLDITRLQQLEADNLRLRLTQQQALFEAVQVAQEAERRRMAESLHNGIGQLLYAVKLRLASLHRSRQGVAQQVIAVRHEAEELLGEAIRQTRALSHELVPITLEKFGLAAALQDIGRNMSTLQLLMRTHVLLDEEAPPLPLALQMALYRMAQELAQNIIKHARGAREASLELETMPGWVLLRAHDNGPGFTATLGTGIGLRSIRDQVVLLQGQFESGNISSGGAYVRIRIPLPPSLPSPSTDDSLISR